MNSKQNNKGGITPDPAETNRDVQQHQKETKEGDYRNAEKAVKTQSIDEEHSRKRWDAEPNRDEMNEADERTGKR